MVYNAHKNVAALIAGIDAVKEEPRQLTASGLVLLAVLYTTSTRFDGGVENATAMSGVVTVMPTRTEPRGT